MSQPKPVTLIHKRQIIGFRPRLFENGDDDPIIADNGTTGMEAVVAETHTYIEREGTSDGVLPVIDGQVWRPCEIVSVRLKNYQQWASDPKNIKPVWEYRVRWLSMPDKNGDQHPLPSTVLDGNRMKTWA